MKKSVLLILLGFFTINARSRSEEEFYDLEFTENDLISTDFFTIRESGTLIEANILRFMRLATEISHRFTDGINGNYLSNNRLSRRPGELALGIGYF